MGDTDSPRPTVWVFFRPGTHKPRCSVVTPSYGRGQSLYPPARPIRVLDNCYSRDTNRTAWGGPRRRGRGLDWVDAPMGDRPKRGGEVRGLERQIVGFVAQRRARAGRSVGSDVEYVKAVAPARDTGGAPSRRLPRGAHKSGRSSIREYTYLRSAHDSCSGIVVHARRTAQCTSVHTVFLTNLSGSHLYPSVVCTLPRGRRPKAVSDAFAHDHEVAAGGLLAAGCFKAPAMQG